MWQTCFDEYYYLSDAERKRMSHKYKPGKIFLEGYNYDDTIRGWWKKSKRRKMIKNLDSKEITN